MTDARHANHALTALLLAMLLTGCAPKPEAVALQIPVNELCTTCNDFIRCEAGGAGADFTLLHLGPKPFLAQLATILDFLLQMLRERQQDFRPLTTYASTGEVTHSGIDAVTDLVRHRIAVPEGWIDQVNGDWHGSNDELLGRCRLLPIAEGRALVKDLGTASP